MPSCITFSHGAKICIFIFQAVCNVNGRPLLKAYTVTFSSVVFTATDKCSSQVMLAGRLALTIWFQGFQCGGAAITRLLHRGPRSIHLWRNAACISGSGSGPASVSPNWVPQDGQIVWSRGGLLSSSNPQTRQRYIVSLSPALSCEILHIGSVPMHLSGALIDRYVGRRNRLKISSHITPSVQNSELVG